LDAARKNQGCGSGSGLDPDSIDFVDPYWESGSRGKKITKFQLFSSILVIKTKIFTTKKANTF
jgi:hypothetical protein